MIINNFLTNNLFHLILKNSCNDTQYSSLRDGIHVRDQKMMSPDID